MAYNKSVDAFRDAEYPMMRDKVYLDHAGTTVYAKSLIETFSRKMIENLYGNPHSASAPAKLSGEVVDSVREKTLAFFNADPAHFDLIFTANATASIKLVAESFRDLAQDSTLTGTFWYGYHKDSHTSLAGVRELTQGTHHCFSSDDEVHNWLSGMESSIANSKNDTGLPGLFAYPGQSNMTGRRLPLNWPAKLRNSNHAMHHNTYTLLDAAALATTSQLDFSNHDTAPDFTAISFYKIFGFPDLGGLIVRKGSGHILMWRRYFGGGTVNSVTVFHEATVQRKDTSIHDNLEDGTLPFHNIMALGCAIDTHKRLYGSMSAISQHTSFLSNRLYWGLRNMHHFNGNAVCTIYTDDERGYGNAKLQGATVAFNLKDSRGGLIGHSFVEKAADEKGIFLRSGGLCNAGGIADYLKLEPWQIKRNWSAGHRCGEAGREILNGKPTGVVRASLGAMSTEKDVDTFLTFLKETYVEALPSKAYIDSTFVSISYDSLQNADSSQVCNMSAVDLPSRTSSTTSHLTPLKIGGKTGMVHNRELEVYGDELVPSRQRTDSPTQIIGKNHQVMLPPIEGLQSVYQAKIATETTKGRKASQKRALKLRRSLMFWKTTESLK